MDLSFLLLLFCNQLTDINNLNVYWTKHEFLVSKEQFQPSLQLPLCNTATSVLFLVCPPMENNCPPLVWIHDQQNKTENTGLSTSALFTQRNFTFATAAYLNASWVT